MRRINELAQRFNDLNTKEITMLVEVENAVKRIQSLTFITRPPEETTKALEAIRNDAAKIYANLNEIKNIEAREAEAVKELVRRAMACEELLAEASKMFQSKLQHFL